MTTDRLDGAVALVTGGSRGIGRATAIALARRGADVAVFAQSIDALGPTVQAIAALGRRALALAGDIARFSDMQESLARVVDALGAPDVLVNNAGVLGSLGAIAELDVHDFERTLAVNLLGTVYGMRLVLPLMIQRGAGVVINLSSGAGQRVQLARATYGTSKVAVDYVTKVAAEETRAHGVRVYAVHPGLIDTDMNAADRARMAPADLERMLARIAAGDMQQPEEPAECIAWLATPDGAAWNEPIVPWREPEVRARIRAMPGFLTMERHWVHGR